MRSIRRQLSIELLATVAVLQVIGLSILYLVARNGIVSGFDDALRAKALAVSKLIDATPSGLLTDAADFYLGAGGAIEVPASAEGGNGTTDIRFTHEFQRRDRHNYFEVWDMNGIRLARSRSLGANDLPRVEGTPERPVIWDFDDTKGEGNRAVGFVFRPEIAGSTGAGIHRSAPVLLVVAAEREALDNKLLRLQVLSAACTLILIGATFWVIPKVLRRGLKPLDELAENVARIDAGILATRLPSAAAPMELHVIIERLNGLLSRLEESFERERRFSADVAHELRTPIAELRGLSECALKWPDAREPGFDGEVLAIARQMETMVTLMLSLARGERGDLNANPEPVEVGPAIEGVLRGFGPRVSDRGLSMRLSPSDVTALADPALLRSILAVLVENAVDYAPREGSIDIRVSVSGTAAEVRVSNPAPDLEEADLARMFDRFWRKERARSGGLHLGLGLSLARAYAAAMGWSLAAELDKLGCLTLILAGPTAVAAPATASSREA